MDQERLRELLGLIEIIQLEMGLVMETWVDKLAEPLPRDPHLLGAHLSGIRQAAAEIAALTAAADALRLRIEAASDS